jgi:hypothetical protein
MTDEPNPSAEAKEDSTEEEPDLEELQLAPRSENFDKQFINSASVGFTDEMFYMDLLESEMQPYLDSDRNLRRIVESSSTALQIVATPKGAKRIYEELESEIERYEEQFGKIEVDESDNEEIKDDS